MTAALPHSLTPDVELTDYNTLRFAYRAQYLCEVETLHQLHEILEWGKQNALTWRIFGGGSNLVICQDLPGITLINRLKGRVVLRENDDFVDIEVCGGENWHELVAWTVAQGWWGLENLALIPGSVGAAPVQNIGAYGVEVKDCILAVEVLDTHTMQLCHLSPTDCDFGYRESAFKHRWAGRYIIVKVCFRLSKLPRRVLNYGGLNQRLAENCSQQEIFDTVCQIRSAKLPNPNELANVGSYFKNPIVADHVYRELLNRYPDLVAFPYGQDWKLAAGWLNEKAGWKGKRVGGVGVYSEQALVLVNYQDRHAAGLLSLQQQIEQSVLAQFGVQLEREPILLPGEAE